MTKSTIDTYDRQAEGYESRWAAYLEHTHSAFLDEIETKDDDVILDISGGTGLLAQKLVEGGYPFGHLVINDPSARMLDIARNRLAGYSKISFCSHRAEELPFEEQHFDRIFCLNSFHFYTHQQRVLDRCFNLLKPGGVFSLLDWNRAGTLRFVNKLFEWGTSEHIDTRTLSELRRMMEESGFVMGSSHPWSWRYWNFLFIEGRKP